MFTYVSSLPTPLNSCTCITWQKSPLELPNMKFQSFLVQFIINSECLNEEFVIFDCRGVHGWLSQKKKSPGEFNLVSLPWKKMTKPCFILAPGKAGRDFRTRKKDLQIFLITLCLYFNYGDSTIPLNSVQCLKRNVSILKALNGIASGWKTNKLQLISITKT